VTRTETHASAHRQIYYALPTSILDGTIWEQVIPAGDRLIVEMPGGGGLGDAAKRDPALVAQDLRNGFISEKSAREVYKVAVRDDLSVEVEETSKLRGRGRAEGG